jgi:diacylglycerol kinase family enzyme
MVFVFNLPQYALDLPIAANARPDDGLLDLCVFERPGLWNLARYLLAVFRGCHGQLPDFQHRLVRRVRLSLAQPMPLQTDGDPAGQLPATIEVVPAGMTLVVPNPEGPLP